jgi:ABC-2 type transport system ATP-binding protein
LGQPDVLLLDEPSNGLDPDGIRWLRESLRRFADQGGTVFVSSHLIAELAMFADDLVVVGGGRLLVAEPVATTMARGDTTVHVRTPDTAELAALLGRADITVHTAGPTLSAHGTTTDIVSQIAFDHQLRIVEISETSRSLEEILLDITGATAEFASA